MEWFPGKTPVEIMQLVLSKEMSMDEVRGGRPELLVTDDRPYNEYFMLRRRFGQWKVIP